MGHLSSSERNMKRELTGYGEKNEYWGKDRKLLWERNCVKIGRGIGEGYNRVYGIYITIHIDKVGNGSIIEA